MAGLKKKKMANKGKTPAKQDDSSSFDIFDGLPVPPTVRMGPHKQDVGTWMTVASADKECQTDPLEASGAVLMAEALKKMAAEMAQMRAEMAQPSHARTSNQERIVFPEALVPAPASTVADFMELTDRIGREIRDLWMPSRELAGVGVKTLQQK